MEIRTNSFFYKNLASYFTSKPLYLDEPTQKKPNTRKLVELPWQQTKGEMWDEVTNTLCNLDFIQAKAAARMTYEMVNDFNAALEVIPDNAENIRKEKERQARMDKYTQDLIACARGEITRFELEVPESIKPWTKEQTEAEIERIKTNPNRADKLRDFTYYLGKESANLQKYAICFRCFAYQQAWNYAVEGPLARAVGVHKLTGFKPILGLYAPSRPSWNPLPSAIKTLRGHSDSVNAVAITPDGKRAISGSIEGTIILWNLNTGQLLKKLIYHSAVNSISITPDCKKAFSGYQNGTCILWNLETGDEILKLKGHTKWVNAVSITPDGKRAVSVSFHDGTCRLWNLDTGETIKTLKEDYLSLNDISITPDGKRAILGSRNKSCILWDMEIGLTVKKLKGHSSIVEAVSITPDGKRAISGSCNKICILWDIENEKVIKKLKGHKGYLAKVEAVSITADGKWAISVSVDNFLWNLDTGQPIETFVERTHLVESVSITPDCKWAISGLSDNTCICWDLEIGYSTEILEENYSFYFLIKEFFDFGDVFAITNDCKKAISGRSTGNCLIMNIENKRQTYKTLKGHASCVKSVSITPDGKRAISGSYDNTCILWNLKTGMQVKTFNLHSHYVSSISITPDGKRAISGSWDNSCILWDLESKLKIKAFIRHSDRINSISITPDGKRAISASNDATCILWNLETKRKLNTFKGHTDWVNAISISPDGKRAISASSDNTCILWNLKSRKAVQTLIGHTQKINNVSITPNGTRAISCSEDRTCILWNLETGEQLACFTANDGIKTSLIILKKIYLQTTAHRIEILDLDKEIVQSGTPITTIRQIWDFELQRYQKLSADCPLCGHRFAPPVSVLAIIEEITKKAGLTPEQSPCLELPDEAWEVPGLLGNCPNCGEALKFNPFIAGGNN